MDVEAYPRCAKSNAASARICSRWISKPGARVRAMHHHPRQKSTQSRCARRGNSNRPSAFIKRNHDFRRERVRLAGQDETGLEFALFKGKIARLAHLPL